MLTRWYKITLCVLAMAGRVYAGSGDSLQPLLLDFGAGAEAAEPERLSIGRGGEIFILDRARAVLARFSAETGGLLWQIDGSESGEPFLDPVYLSRPDGFFITSPTAAAAVSGASTTGARSAAASTCRSQPTR